MAAMETLSQAIDRLTSDGYSEHFHPENGQLVCEACDDHANPSNMQVDEVVRFEGSSDPDDQAILYALETACGHRGLYSASYGAGASSEDVEVILALPAVA